MKLPAALKQLAEVLTDSYFVVDLERNIVDFNRAFYSMLPRRLARNLTNRKCYEVLKLDICQERCVAKGCWATERPARLDEITGEVEGDATTYRFIISAIPIRDDTGKVIGAMEVQRNVTDEAAVQTKYKQQLEAGEEGLAKAEEALEDRTRQLLQLGRRLAKYEEAMLAAKTQIFGALAKPKAERETEQS